MKPVTIINLKVLTLKKILVMVMGICLVMMALNYHTASASGLNLADIPLDSLEQAAPGMIMFVMDDSGSMDWSIMCPPSQEGDGVFNGRYYIFPNPGDNEYSYSSLEESSTVRMQWMSQWAGYNGMYYDPTTEYTPWPTLSNADVDNPKSNPMLSYTLDMTATWHTWDDEYGVIVDNSDASGFASSTSTGWTQTSGGWENNYLYSNGSQTTVTATWTASSLDTSTTYDVYARWLNGGSSRLTDVHYLTYDDTTQVADTGVNQQQNHNTWMQIASGVTFSTGTGVVTISEDGGGSKVCADAVKFVPTNNPLSDIARRHYYVQNDNGTYLVNMFNGAIEYYQVNLDDSTDNREVVTSAKLVPLTATEANTAGIVTGRTYNEEIQNFANWYSFYRRRELTAKNAIANVIATSDGIFVGIFFINDYHSKDQRVLPVKVNLDGTFYDDTATLLDILYNYQIGSYGTPLRNGLKKAGRFFSGDYEKPSTFIAQVNSDSYPYFKADKGGSCQQAFTIIFTDGYWNGGSPSVGNEDGNGDTAYDGSPFGDSASSTLADVAMKYYEDDLNTTLSNDVPITNVDPADHQHMVTYTVAFGVSGSLDTELYKDCSHGGTCPTSWPSTGTDSGKIDDMFHAAVNGRGQFISAKSTAELNAALEALKKDIDSRIGSAAALATNSIQRTVGSTIYQGIYNTSNWYGELTAYPLDVTTGVIGSAKWVASDHIPAWDTRKILSYNGSAGIVFDDANLTTTQKSVLTAGGLGTSEEIVDFIRGDTSNNVAHSGTLRTRTHILGDFVHSAPTYFKDVVYIGANDGMLHAFDAGTGEELFAYVPGLVYDHLSYLADPGYTHRFYVDNTATVADIGSTDLLVGGLRKGGKGYFAIDVTDPSNMAASKVLWEYTAASDDDIGYSYSQAAIVNTKAEGYVVIFGNGYDSVNGEAVLYVLEAETGAVLEKFETGVTGNNGMSTPAIVDVEMDGVVDYAFAGDLLGNMWKFDLRGSNKTDWTFSYMDGATPKPLISVKNKSGEVQPITAAPTVMLDCADLSQGRGLMVLFGTGQYVNSDDFDDTTVQSMYGIWDWGPMWEGKENFSVAKTKFLGTLNTDRSLSNITGGKSLLEQVFEYTSGDFMALSDYPIYWYNPVESTGSHLGWVVDLPESGERSIYQPLLSDYVAMFVSTIPSNSPCDAGGSSAIYQFNACSGGRTSYPVFDSDDDNDIDDDDVITGSPDPVPPTRKKFPKRLLPPTRMGDIIIFPDADGGLNPLPTLQPQSGMFFWRVIER
jgi:type IV pilus assembly protein PilY1